MKQEQVVGLRISRFARAATFAAVFLAAASPVFAQTVTVRTSPPVQIGRAEGYMGVVYSGIRRVSTTVHGKEGEAAGQRVLVSYAAYPVVVSVEPGSPAARAGLTAGDTVMSYNGFDVVKESFPLYEMLRPGQRITMRVRRDGRVRNVSVLVGRRPASTPAAQSYVVTTEMAEQVRREVERAQEHARKELEKNRDLTEAQRTELERLAREAAVARVSIRPAPAPPAAPVTPGPMVVFSPATLSGVAGAEMTPMNDDLAGLVGVRRGVFVVRVNPGTPADQSGLRGGDVIIAVGDSSVNDVGQLRRAINAEQRRIRTASAAREIPIEIVRKHRKQRVVLRY